MHDPCTVAFEIRWLDITIWHVDPEKDGTDDSCGWFKRARHGSPEIRKKIRNRFESEWDSEPGGWFTKTGEPIQSVHSIVISMFLLAAKEHFRGRFDKYGWNGATKFMRKYLYDILHFAENHSDSMWHMIVSYYGQTPREERIDNASSIVYGCILGWTRPWWRHPKWHIHHWRFQIGPIQRLKRKLFSRCGKCRKPFKWNESPVSSSWDSDGPRWFRGEQGVFHMKCYDAEFGKSLVECGDEDKE